MSKEPIIVMADVRSVHTHLQHYEQHMARLEELRGLLYDQLAHAVAQPCPSAGRVRRRTARRRVAAIEAALERMDRGLYGTCQCCGAFIAFEQLRRRPHRRTCEGCALARRHEVTA
ncbi:TraR/DksA C4-type zinc finger protein [Nonomuraea sp. 3-1Str]|uniref:TraR/DksA family transcriptional regulator n=1 Tax=unclassified Nonomuraea TaxID=2593643 RepID=UPI00285D3FC3|nr:TraR/DksA C4-type zinc finger protein [Nonomuraea sp. 3-1Str]MDR8414397.1 hypothetical protein [Nonomuraea sp. 3-1Str]